MIIFRYIARELLITTAAVSSVLLLIVMSSRFIRYLARAAIGVFEPQVLLEIMLYRIPGFLQLILPLGLFLGILLTLGRMYVDNEITILTMAGVSQKTILNATFMVAAVVAINVAIFSLGLTPQGARKVSNIINEQDTLTEFDTLTAGRFLTMRGTGRVTYVEELQDERSKLRGVFIAATDNNNETSLLVAQKGHQQLTANGDRYLILQNGARYDGNLGFNNYRITQFDTYGILVSRPAIKANKQLENISTRKLLINFDRHAQIELYWRISLAILTLVITTIAVPLAKVNPRQGRFVKILPAILLYMMYLTAVISVNGALHKNDFPVELGFGLVHALFLAIGMMIYTGFNPLKFLDK